MLKIALLAKINNVIYLIFVIRSFILTTKLRNFVTLPFHKNVQL